MAAKTKDKVVDTLDILELEKEIASVETDAVEEEKVNASSAYAILDKQLSEIIAQIPYPDTEEYTTASDYEELSKLQWEKSLNRPYWDKCKAQRAYCNSGRLYCGHLLLNDSEYYIMDSLLDSRLLGDGSSIRLVNADDKNFVNVVKAWRYPDKKRGVSLSRNVAMKDRKIESVEVVLDVNNDMFSTITDSYLRKALIRNRKSSNSDPGTNMQSIIQRFRRSRMISDH